MNDKQNPIPCTATAAMAIGKALRVLVCPTLTDELMRLPAKGAVSRRGYAGNTQTGVIVCIGKILHIDVKFGQD